MNTVNSVDILTKDSYEPLTRSQLLDDYKDVFEGLGSFPGEYKIETDPSVRPVQHQPRKVHQAMKQEIHTKLKDLENRCDQESHNSNRLDKQHADCEETRKATHMH